MPVLALKSALLSDPDGVPGNSSQVGTCYTDNRILAGQKQLDLSCLLALSAWSSLSHQTSSYSATTSESLKVGALADIGIMPLMAFSNAYIDSLKFQPTSSVSSSNTFLVQTILQISPLVAYTACQANYSLPNLSQMSCKNTSLTQKSPSLPKSSVYSEKGHTPNLPPTLLDKSVISRRHKKKSMLKPEQKKNSLPESSEMTGSEASWFNVPIPFARVSNKVCLYPPNQTLLPLPNCPHCPARDYLHQWIPQNSHVQHSTGNPDNPSIPKAALDQVLEVISTSWADSTKELYRTALLVFHVYCDLNCIPELEHCPIDHLILITFLSSLAGGYSGSMVANYTAGLRAWHILHGHTWNINVEELKLMLQGAAKLTPKSSKKLKWLPITLDDLAVIQRNMNLSDPGDATIFACLTVVFFCITRLGEFTVPAIAKFNPTKHITQCNATLLQDAQNWLVLKFSIPVTKCSPNGENRQCAPLPGELIDPAAVLENHFHIN